MAMHATHQGNVLLDIEASGRVISIILSDVLYVLDWNEVSGQILLFSIHYAPPHTTSSLVPRQ